MRTTNKHVWRLLAPLLLLLWQPTTTLASDFPIGGWYAYREPVHSLYEEAGFTAYYGPVDTGGHPIFSIDTLAARGWMIFGTTLYDESDTNSHFKTGVIQNTIQKAHMIHWEAENEDSIPLWGRESGTKVRHPRGSTTGAFWYIDSTVGIPDTIAWELSEHLQSQDRLYTALFYMKIDTIGTETDIVAKVQILDSVYVKDPELPDSTIILKVDTIRAERFLGNDSLTPISMTYQKNNSRDPINCIIRIDWAGTRRLSMDSVVLFSEEARKLMRDDPSQLREDILAQAAAYSSACLPGTSTPALKWWYGTENNRDIGYGTLDKMEPARFLDSMLGANYGQAALWDRNLTFPFQYPSEDAAWFETSPLHFTFWSYVFSKQSYYKELGGVKMPAEDNLDSLQTLFGSLITALEYARARTDSVQAELSYVAQAYALRGDSFWAADRDPPQWMYYGDTLRPSTAELKCASFLGLCYGVDGLWFWPYDDARFANRGMVLVSGDTLRPTHKYDAVKDCIAPFAKIYGDMKEVTDYEGSGRLDSPESIPGSFITSVTFDDLTDSYVQAGFFEASGVADYALLVNRNTSDSTDRTLTLTMSTTALTTHQTHYYIIDMNPNYGDSSQDTTLAGPMDGGGWNGILRYTTKIDPGGAKLIKVVPAPDRIAGTNFPEKWWGTIHVDANVTVPAGRSLQMSAPLHCYVHSECAHGPQSPVEFRVAGQLIAHGTPDSAITFDFVDDNPERQCIGEHPGRWGGFVMNSAPACTLECCEIRNAVRGVYDSLTPLVLDYVTMDNAIQEPSVVILDSGMQCRIANSTLRGGLLLTGGSVSVDSSSVRYAGTAVHARECTLTSTNCTIEDFTEEGIHVDTGSVATVRKTTINAGSTALTGVVFQGGQGTVDSCSWLDLLGTAAIADPGPSGTVTFRNWVVDSAYKGILALSGTVVIDSCQITHTSYTGVDASSGDAVVRMDSSVALVKFNWPAAAVSIGQDAQLIAKDCRFDSSYIGLELKGDGADTIIGCVLSDNMLYGIWFDGSSSADCSANNVVEGLGGSGVNVGMHVLQQSIVSSGDVVLGGYNWDYNINTYHTPGATAHISDLVILGKDGDDWGLVLNGISASNDGATVDNAIVSNTFSQAHMYIRQIDAKVTNCTLESTDSALSASPIGVDVRDANTGYFGCTAIRGQWTCIKRRSSTSSIDWSDMGSAYAEAGYNEYSTSLQYTFDNDGTDTVDARRCYWGESPPEPSKMDGPINYANYLDSAQCGPGEPPAKMAATGAELPDRFSLDQNHPNPFNPVTTISFALPIEQSVRIEIYNLLGRRVRLFDLGVVSAGDSSVNWDGTLQSGQPVGSGVYLYRISTPEFMDTKKMLLLK